jgi:hypothetical protein
VRNKPPECLIPLIVLISGGVDLYSLYTITNMAPKAIARQTVEEK